jgi:hypothetical protein
MKIVLLLAIIATIVMLSHVGAAAIRSKASRTPA